jgi:anti-sigma factor RsiW
MDAAELSDEELVAYLDNALPADRYAEIEAMSASNEAVRDRIAALEMDMGAIRSAFDLHLASAPLNDLRRRLAAVDKATPSPRNWRWMQLAAAVIIGVAVGSGAMDVLHRSSTPDWHMAVAEYQALYTTDTLKSLGNDRAVLSRGVASAAAALGQPITVERLEVAGLTLKRAQILEFDNHPLVQFAYLDADGTPIAFCATRTGGADRSMESTTLNGLATAFWNKGGYGYMVIGGRQTAAIETIARTLEPRI